VFAPETHGTTSSSDLVLVIDIGSSSTRAALYDSAVTLIPDSPNRSQCARHNLPLHISFVHQPISMIEGRGTFVDDSIV